MRWLGVLLVVGCSASARDARHRPGPGTGGGADEARGPLRLDPLPPGERQVLDLTPHRRRLAASHGYTCAIDDGGDLWCWGSRSVGNATLPAKVGPGATYIVASREPYGPLCTIGSDGVGHCNGLAVKDAVDIGVGTRIACGLDRRGVVSCTGITPQDVPPATQLSVGQTHACARLADGGVYCWGQNFLGQLGVDTKIGDSGDVEARVPIRDVAGVAAGSAFTCAWKTDGSVWCWGDTAFGGLGSLGTSSNHTAHATPVLVPGVKDAVEVVAGSHLACALDRASNVTCWGAAYQGAIGADVQQDSGPIRIAFTQPVEEIVLGGAHACVRARGGSIWCWGWNEYGQLGNAEKGSTWRAQQVALGAGAVAAAKPTGATITTTKSGARRVELVLDSAASLQAAGWRRIPGGMSTFSGGALHIEANGFDEWSLTPDHTAVGNPFIGEAGNPPGWAIEVKLQLDAPCSKLGTGLWIHDGFHYLTARLDDHRLVAGGVSKDIGSTLTPRVIRLSVDHETLSVLVDGRMIGTSAISEGQASQSLMFGVLGDGCGRDRSTWYYIAYETFPAPPRTWPPRDEWHPGTTSDQIASALPPSARADAKGRDAACLAVAAVDGAVRDLLPLGYDALGVPTVARSLRNTAPLVDAQAREQILGWLRSITTPIEEPICDPVPGGRCPPPRAPVSRHPVPPIAKHVIDALRTAKDWADHPKLAERAVRMIADAYAKALASKLPGAEGARDQLVRRIKALTATASCGLTTPTKRAQ